jgi:molecular chaperone DnaK (HSP70)
MNAHLLCGAGLALALLAVFAAWHWQASQGQTLALDLGTSNSVLARWDPEAGKPEVVELPGVSPRPARETEALARGIPSAIHLVGGRRGPTLIGDRALAVNHLQARRGVGRGIKPALAQSPRQTGTSARGKSVSAREATELFVRELLAEARRETGQRVRELVITTPVESYETYRAELSAIGRRLGLRRIRFLDEPVAAALGYGLSLARERRVLVVDFGGGTLDLALVHLGAEQAQKGRAEVLAKAGRALGGDTIDGWLVEEFSRRLGWTGLVLGDALDEMQLRLMQAEARRVKEAVYFDGAAHFEPPFPEARRAVEGESLELSREALARVLGRKGLYHALDECLRELLAQARARGVCEDDIDDVLMVGGSTLLPGVYPVFERALGREKVRAWQPFEAVACGAAVFAAGEVAPRDFIVHDYALETWEPGAREPKHAVIVTAGTRFPTEPDLWKRQLVPACRLGEPEEVFKLVVCELGAAGGGKGFAWNGEGEAQRVDGSRGEKVVVKLNEASPTMGKLRPAHPPGDQAPRLEVSFGVNAERWLCSTVVDLRSRKVLLRDAPVVRLL